MIRRLFYCEDRSSQEHGWNATNRSTGLGRYEGQKKWIWKTKDMLHVSFRLNWPSAARTTFKHLSKPLFTPVLGGSLNVHIRTRTGLLHLNFALNITSSCRDWWWVDMANQHLSTDPVHEECQTVFTVSTLWYLKFYSSTLQTRLQYLQHIYFSIKQDKFH